MNCEPSVDDLYDWLLLSLVSLAMMLLAVETRVSNCCVSIRVLLRPRHTGSFLCNAARNSCRSRIELYF